MAGRLRLRPALRRYAHSVQRRATPGFAGPYDAIPDIVAAYGMRRLLSAYEGPILRLRRDGDQAEQDFGYTDNGDLDTAAVAAFVGAGSGYITTWYDQSGNGNHAVQTTAAAQPLYVASGQNGRPVARFSNAHGFTIASIVTSSLLFVLNLSAADTHQILRISENTITLLPIAQAGSTSIEIYRDVGTPTMHVNGVLTTPTNRDQMHAAITGATKIVVWTGVDLTDSGRFGGAYGFSLNSFSITGDLPEIVIASAAWSDTDRQAAEAAANNYWGVF